MKLDNNKAVLQSLTRTPNSKSLKNNNDIIEIVNPTKIEVSPDPNGHETNNVGFWPVTDFDGSESKGNKIADDTKLFEIHIDEKPEHKTLDVSATNELAYSIKLEGDSAGSGLKDVVDNNLSANPKLGSVCVSDGLVSSNRDFYGESSFSMSSLIAYSGSLSLRSESSTTSTRSFAFPIMQNEWNSSPVKMAKADRSWFRKHKGWKQGILCCRF